MRTFLVIWAGQLISLLGSGLTGFALSVYVFQRTGSTTQLSLSILAAVLPNVLISPVAGALVDRWDRRKVMLLSDTAAGLSSLVIFMLLANGQLEIWHIYVANAFNSFFGAFQRPAYMASITMLVPKEHFGRAAGLGQVSGALRQIVSPILAGMLIATIQIEGVILIDFATYIVATLTLLAIRIPRPETSQAGRAAQGSMWRQASYGWSYIKARPGLMGMLIMFASINFSLGFFSALYSPLVLAFAQPDTLGAVMSAGGMGMLTGSLVMSAWGGAKRKIDSLVASIFIFGIFLGVTGLRPDPLLIGMAGFIFFACLPIANGSSQAIWQSKIPPDVQGRVFATRGMIAQVASPLALVLAGPLADKVMEPLLAADGELASILGPIMGVGPGRGIGLIFILMGLSISLAAVVGYLSPRVRQVEQELPDVVVASAPSPASAEGVALERAAAFAD